MTLKGRLRPQPATHAGEVWCRDNRVLPFGVAGHSIVPAMVPMADLVGAMI